MHKQEETGMRRHDWGIRSGALVAALGLVFGASATMAQDATPAATLQVTGQVAHPGHIHAGDCANLGDVVFPLSDAGVPATGNQDMGATPMAAAGGAEAGSEMAIPAYVSITQLDASIEDILAAPHAINFHESADNIENYIACGEIGGVSYGDNLQFGLRELNGSGYTGVGLISSDADGGVNVLVYLSPTGR
jgi:hypothetical protein